MKISKNTLLGLGILSAMAVVSLFALSGHKALAAPAPLTPDQLAQATYKYVSPIEVDATIGGNTYVFVDDGIDNIYNYKAKNTTLFCDGTVVGSNGFGNTLKGITLDMSFNDLVAGAGKTANAIVNLDYVDASGACQNYHSKVVLTKQADGSFVGSLAPVKQGDPCTAGADCGTDGTCTKDGGDCTDNPIPDTCNDHAFGFSMTWLVCPLLDVADSATNELYSLFEGQLSFSIEQLGNGQTQVQKSWGLMRDLATAMIVIIALVMIISQAASFGPFDAYTIRKMLPRIVAAVILIQISWVGVKFGIDLVNTIGRGIANLMYFPFGGSDQMGLFALLHNAGLTTDVLAPLNWAGLLIGGALVVSFLFTVLGLAFTAILALLVALFTLIFRKILIIILIIFAPLALLAWILPGTERYWKMWRDNLIKVLFMFPIVVALIAAGRIFAYVVGAQGANVGGDHLMNLVFVLVGFFGPLFLLPKTFKWGGQAMSLAGGAISNTGTKIGAPGKNLFKKRQETYSTMRSNASRKRFADNERFDWKKPKSYYRRPLDLVKSGKWDPTLVGEMSRHAQDDYVHSGEEAEKKDIEAARSRLVRTGQAIRARGGNHDLFYQKAGDGEKEYWDKDYVNDDGTTGKLIEIGDLNETEQAAARTQTAILGSATNWRYLEELYQKMNAKYETGDKKGQYIESEAERKKVRKFFDDNVDKIMPKMPHFYQGYGATAETSGPALAGLHAVEVESTLSYFSKEIQEGHREYETEAARAADTTLSTAERTKAATARDSAERRRNGARKSLLTFTENIREAAKNPNINLDVGVLKAAKGFLDPTDGTEFRTQINQNPANAQTLPAGVSVKLKDGSVLAPGTVMQDPNGRATRGIPELVPYTALTGPGGGLDAETEAKIKGIADELAPKINMETGAIDRVIGGTVTAPRAPAPTVTVTPTPGELRITHKETVNINLPTGAELANPTQFQTYKARLQTDASAVQSLAHGLAYGVVDDKAAHLRVLDALKTEIEGLPTTTDGEKAARAARVGQYNGMLDQIRQAYTQRITQTAQAAADRGMDRSAALTAAQNRLAPEINVDVESRRIV